MFPSLELPDANQFEVAAFVRGLNASAKGRASTESWTVRGTEASNLHAFGAERALSLFTGREWTGPIAKEYPDVSPNIDVKWTHTRPHYILVVECWKIEKYPDRVYASVPGLFPRYEMVGYMTGREIIEKGQKRAINGPVSYWVDAPLLHPATDLVLTLAELDPIGQ